MGVLQNFPPFLLLRLLKCLLRFPILAQSSAIQLQHSRHIVFPGLLYGVYVVGFGNNASFLDLLHFQLNYRNERIIKNRQTYIRLILKLQRKMGDICSIEQIYIF